MKRKSVKMNDCTKENPMPENRESTGQGWMHHDVTELEDFDTMGILFRCNSCGLEFIAANSRE